MENHSRSASPREAPRPQHRPPSPPTPPTVPSAPSAPTAPSAFDNRAYQHDEADPNHNDSFTSATPQNGHSKAPNGETKTPEAVNLELINLTPKNGNAKKKDVELDMNSANPYDEYFVSVNEHRKYMRGEKLYVTADKRGEKGGCKRPLCWTLLALVIAAVIALIVLAATGVLTSSSPTAVDQYNSTISSARAFGGLTSSDQDHAHDHDHDHANDYDHDHAHDHDHDHAHDHEHEYDHGYDHDANNNHEHTNNTSDEANVAQNDEDVPALEESNESAMYVPRTLEGQLRIDNEKYTEALSDPDSEEYHKFVATFSEELRRALFNRTMLEDNNNEINVQVIELRNGSVIVTYRVHWKPKFRLESPKDLMTANSLKANLEKYLATNNRMISIYHIAEDKMQASNVLDLCQINNNDCSHGCIFDEKSLDFICTCPRGQILDMHNPKKCISIFEYSDNQESQKEVRVLGVNSHPESKEISPNPVSVNVAEHEHTIDWKDNGPISEERTTESESDITHFSHVFGYPEEPEPSSEPKSSGESEPKSEPKPVSEPEPAAEPKAEPEPSAEQRAEPTAEPETEPESTSESKTEPSSEPKVEPQSSANPKAESEPTAEPKAEPEPTAELKAEPEPTAEPKAEPEPTAEPKAEPEPTAEPKAEPEPTAEPKPEPEPTADPKAEPEPTAEPKAEPVTTAEPKTELKPEPVATTEQKPEPEPTGESKPKPESTFELKPEFQHAPEPKHTSESIIEAENPAYGEPESKVKSEPKLNANQGPTSKPKSDPEPQAETSPQNELAITGEYLPEVTAESKSEHTLTSTVENSYESEPTFMPSLADIIGVEPEHVFVQESDSSEDSDTVTKPKTNHPIAVKNQPISKTALEQNTSSNRTYIESKPTDYFSIFKHVNGEILETMDTTTTQGAMVQNNSEEKGPAFIETLQQSGPVTEINLKPTTNKTETEKLNFDSATTMESLQDALDVQTHKSPEHMFFNNVSSIIKSDNQTTDENVDPLFILLNGKSLSESTTTSSKTLSNSNTTTVTVTMEPEETLMEETLNMNDKAPDHSASGNEKSNIPFVIDDGTFIDTNGTKQAENVTELEPVTESFITDNENSTETQEVGASSEEIYNLQPIVATTERAQPETAAITLNMLLNRSSKAIPDSDNSNKTSFEMKIVPVNAEATTESVWLSEPVTEISYKNLMHKMENQLTTESSANAVAQVINGAHINDFEPDYLTQLGPTYAPEPNELLYTVMSDYDSQEARFKRVNQEEKVSKIATNKNPETNISHSILHIIGAQEINNSSVKPTENNHVETTTLQEQNITNESTIKTVLNTVTEHIHGTPEKKPSEPAPVWEDSGVVKETLATVKHKSFPAATTLSPENNAQVNVNQAITSAQISNLNVTIYEKPINNKQTYTTTKSSSHSAEYDDHEKETNPFLPEVENNNSLVKKLQEGHDLEPNNINDTQNENTHEHSTLIMDSIKPSSLYKSSVKFSSSNETIPATTTEDDSFDDLLRENSRKQISKATESETNEGNENDDGLHLSTFLLDTDDLDVKTHKSTNSEKSAEESDFTTHSPEVEDEDYLSVVPAPVHEKSSDEREASKKNYKSKNIEEINDIIVDFSQKKSDKRTLHEFNTSN